jgi:hypothetical protein
MYEEGKERVLLAVEHEKRKMAAEDALELLVELNS